MAYIYTPDDDENNQGNQNTPGTEPVSLTSGGAVTDTSTQDNQNNSSSNPTDTTGGSTQATGPVQLSEASTPAGSGGSGGSTSGAKASPAATPTDTGTNNSNAPGNFTNLQTYLQNNGPSSTNALAGDIAGNITSAGNSQIGQIQNQTQQAIQNYDTTQQAAQTTGNTAASVPQSSYQEFLNDLGNGTIGYDASQTSNGTNGYTGIPSDLQPYWQQIISTLNGQGYTPSNDAGSPQYSQIEKEIQSAITNANAAVSGTGGVEGQTQQILGNPSDYGTQAGSLDAALLGENPNGQAQIQQAAQNVLGSANSASQGLQGQFQGVVNALNSSNAANQAASDNQKSNITTGLQNDYTNLQNSLNNQLTTDQTNTGIYNDIVQALTTGNLSQLTTADKQQMASMGIDPNVLTNDQNLYKQITSYQAPAINSLNFSQQGGAKPPSNLPAWTNNPPEGNAATGNIDTPILQPSFQKLLSNFITYNGQKYGVPTELTAPTSVNQLYTTQDANTFNTLAQLLGNSQYSGGITAPTTAYNAPNFNAIQFNTNGFTQDLQNLIQEQAAYTQEINAWNAEVAQWNAANKKS